jgi:DNA-directed RNA polymerase subunit M/transcription elongation factor TFIIS
MEYCPNCIEPLISESKKLGQVSIWLVCPKCGLRKRPESKKSVIDSVGHFSDRRKSINSNNKFKNTI